jgi:hypothetical protein
LKALNENVFKDIPCIVSQPYQHGNFRTIYSSSDGENRPLIKCTEFSDNFEDIESFVGYRKTNNNIITHTERI